MMCRSCFDHVLLHSHVCSRLCTSGVTGTGKVETLVDVCRHIIGRPVETVNFNNLAVGSVSDLQPILVSLTHPTLLLNYHSNYPNMRRTCRTMSRSLISHGILKLIVIHI